MKMSKTGIQAFDEERKKQIHVKGYDQAWHVNGAEYYRKKQLLDAAVKLQTLDATLFISNGMKVAPPEGWDKGVWGDIVEKARASEEYRIRVAGAFLAAYYDQLFNDCQGEIKIDIRQEAGRLILEELRKARRKFPEQLKSSHEGFAVILEELEEAEEELHGLQVELKEVWRGVRSDDVKYQRSAIIKMTEHALDLVKEGIQVGAMIHRFEMELLD